ncbi:MAG: methylation-associated defense system restriction endonuclease subunit S MAD5 [Phocaeicola coprophilus]|uniref:methylation-associated defense system restriction endonuclease subunit S MAD5 n=1 Tax=Phocaeicola TaxID=909656 RepID=UPI003992DD39
MKTGYIHRKSMNPCGLRFDSSYHLSDGVAVKRVIASSPYPLMPIEKAADRIFIGGRARRVYVKDREHGIPFLSSSDILQADLEAVKLASKKYTPNVEDMKLQKGWTLITRSGTIGNCAFANAKHAQKLASEHVIRLVPNNILREGYIYAYLASKQGYSLLTQGTFGAVIQHIEPAYVASLPIPVAPESFQQEVDDLIQESARLREEAADALTEAHRILKSELHSSHTHNKIVSIKNIYKSHNQRFEANYYASENRELYDLMTQQFKCTRLKDLCERIFRPGIFKRQYVNTDGITFLGGADILNATPSSYKQLSKLQVKKMPELMPKQGTILVTCGGTIGNTVYVDTQLASCAVSQHVMRLIPNGTVPNGYLYAFLSSDMGKKIINLFAFGSVIPQVEAHHLELLPVPILENNKMEHIDALCMRYVHCNEKAKENERQAISMVEQQIDSWSVRKEK